jgi:hypothetical protein
LKTLFTTKIKAKGINLLKHKIAIAALNEWWTYLANCRATYLLHHDEIILDRTATGQYKNVGELSNRLEDVAARLAFCVMTIIFM